MASHEASDTTPSGWIPTHTPGSGTDGLAAAVLVVRRVRFDIEVDRPELGVGGALGAFTRRAIEDGAGCVGHVTIVGTNR